MRILFITSNRLGDAILSMGVLAHFLEAHPGAELTVVTGALPATLYRAAPGLTRIKVVTKSPFAWHWLKTYVHLASKSWDLLVDLRHVAIMRALPAKRRIFGSDTTGKRHRIEDFAATLGLDGPPAPKIWLDEDAATAAAGLIPNGGPVLALGPSAGPRRKAWRADRYAEVAKALTSSGGALADARIAIFAGPGPREHLQTQEILALLPTDRVIDLVGKTDPLTAAAALGRCDAFVGVDSGLMHLAAAMKVPTLGLFGDEGVPQVYRPWGKNTAFVSRRNPGWESAKLRDGSPDRRAPMDNISAQEVIEAATEMLRRAKDHT